MNTTIRDALNESENQLALAGFHLTNRAELDEQHAREGAMLCIHAAAENIRTALAANAA